MDCTATTKRGTPCKARPLKDRDVCLAHADVATRTSANFQQGPRPGRPPNPRVVDVLRERIEREVEAVIEPLFDALTAERMYFDNNGEGWSSKDHQARLAAVRELLDRGYGKPKQATELSGTVGVVSFADLAQHVE